VNLRLRYFGIVRERLGRREETRSCADGITVGELVADLARSHDILALGAGSLRIAVNREYVGDGHVLADGDEVAVIPPVAGGSGRAYAAESVSDAACSPCSTVARVARRQHA
jgi:molybdopterin synthase catalytic subunit